VAAEASAAAMAAGFIINPVGPDTLRLAPPFVLTETHVNDFAHALPAILDAAGER